jgi:hypothetical protein
LSFSNPQLENARVLAKDNTVKDKPAESILGFKSGMESSCKNLTFFIDCRAKADLS